MPESTIDPVLAAAHVVTALQAIVAAMPRPSLYAAIYYPWLRVFDPRTRDTVLAPHTAYYTGRAA